MMMGLLNDDEDNEYEEDEEKCDCGYEDPDSPTTSSDDDELNPSLLFHKQQTRGYGRSSRDPGITEASNLRLKNEGGEEAEAEQPSDMVIDQHYHQQKKPGTDEEPHTEEDANALHLNESEVDALHDKNDENEGEKQEGEEAHHEHDETDETERGKEETPVGEEDAKIETQTPSSGGDFHTNRASSKKPSSCCKSPSKKQQKRKKRNPSSAKGKDSPQAKGIPVPLEPRAAVPRFPHPAVSSTTPVKNPTDEGGRSNPLIIGRRARLPDLGNLLKRKTASENNEKDDGGRSPSGSEKKDNHINKDPRGGRSPMSIGELESFLKISPSNTHKRMIQQQQHNNTANSNNSEHTNNNRRDNTNDNINLDGPAGTYATFAYLRINGKREPLPNRDRAAALLQELEHTVLIPICKHFGLRYNFFGEAHCQAKKAGMTIKDPLILKKEVPGSEGETVTELRGYQTTIRIRVRVHPSKGDPKTTFMSGGTLRAVLLHEIAHLRVMNHGKNFMLFLREVFQYAAEELGVFKEHPPNEIPSPWPWENVIYQSLGKVSDEELIPVFDAHRAAEKAKLAKLALEEQGKEEEEVKIEKPNDANNEVNQEQQAEQEEPNEGPKTEEPNEVPKTEESNEANLLREVEPVEGPLEPSVSRTDLLALAGHSPESEEKKAPRIPFFLIEALLAMNKGPEKGERGAQLMGE